jgi:hypothetical protein
VSLVARALSLERSGLLRLVKVGVLIFCYLDETLPVLLKLYLIIHY